MWISSAINCCFLSQDLSDPGAKVGGPVTYTQVILVRFKLHRRATNEERAQLKSFLLVNYDCMSINLVLEMKHIHNTLTKHLP